MDAAGWDERYRASELVWGVEPNRWVAEQLADAQPGIALDLACGEGRNAVWLAGRGWRVYAVDFSSVALEKGRELERRQPVHPPIGWLAADVTEFSAPEPVDLALLCYLQVDPAARRSVVRAAAEALAPGGTLLVIAHDSRNLADGTGGPQDPAVLYTAADVTADLAGCGLRIDRAGEVLRPVTGAERPAIDALLRATRET
jgi:SAM-dependent methyltransferase